MLQVPLRTYSESTFLVSPGRMGRGSLACPSSWYGFSSMHTTGTAGAYGFVNVQNILHWRMASLPGHQAQYGLSLPKAGASSANVPRGLGLAIVYAKAAKWIFSPVGQLHLVRSHPCQSRYQVAVRVIVHIFQCY